MERLYYEGEWRALATLPLEAYFSSAPKSRPKDNKRWSTALLRKYIGSWEIRDGRLYLVGLKFGKAAVMDRDDGLSKDGLRKVFPDADEVFAEWFTGVLRCPEGDLLTIVRAGFGSTYERDLLIGVEEGVVQSTELKKGEPGNRYRDLGLVPDNSGLPAIMNLARRLVVWLSRPIKDCFK